MVVAYELTLRSFILAANDLIDSMLTKVIKCNLRWT
jgi:hypothetical protein